VYRAAWTGPGLLTGFIESTELVKRDPALEELPLERRVGVRNTLAQALRWRFKEYGNPGDLRRAITLWQEALELSAEFDIREYQASFNNSLAMGFDALFGVTGDRAFRRGPGS
jgi:hypothetical protein